MGKSLLIGKLIYSALTTDTNISAAVGTRVFPIVAENDTQFPFIVYSRTNAYPQTGTKDGYDGDFISFQISILSDTYMQGCEIADKVRDLFENCIISNSEWKIYNIRMTSANESFDSDTYLQELYFECNAE